MASKASLFIRFMRLPSLISPNYRFYSVPSAAHTQNPPLVSRSNPASSEFESAVRFLKNKLQPDRLIHVLDSTSDAMMAVSVFRWASTQKNFWQTPETYSRIILRVGMAGELDEMENLLKEMVRLESSNVAEILEFLIHSFCASRRVEEASRLLAVASSTNCRVSVSTCNALLGALDLEKGCLQSTLFAYKEMVKAGILPDVDTLNYLIKALCEAGCLESALEQFNRMSKKRCEPSSRTFEILISALCANGQLDESVIIFHQMLELGCNPHLGFYINIIPLFCKADRLEEGNKLLKMMKDGSVLPDSYLYSVLIECLCKHKQIDEAVELFEEMTDSGLAPMSATYVDIVKGYCSLGKLSDARSFLKKSNSLEIEPYNAILKSYCDADEFLEAISFLERMTENGLTDSLSWNILIRGLCERGYAREAFVVLGKMVTSSNTPDQATYSAIVTGYCKLGAYIEALEQFVQARGRSMSLDPVPCSELIEGLCQIKKIQVSIEVFHYVFSEGCGITNSSLNILIRELCLIGKVDEAIRLRSLACCSGTSCNHLTYAIILCKLLELNKVKSPLVLLSQMFVEGCSFDAPTYCIMIRGLCDESTVKEASLLFDQMVRDCFLPDPETLETLVLCMVRCCQLHSMMHTLDRLINEEGILTPTACNTIISGLLKEGCKHEASKFLDCMLDKGWVPNADTHGLLVGNNNVDQRDATIKAYKDIGDDEVSSILAEGLES